MRRYILQRCGHLAIVLFVASVIVFLLMQVLGDPVAMRYPLGTPQTTLDQARASLGLNDPVLVQYWRFLKNAVTGDFGESLWLGRPAFDEVIVRLPNTFMLVLPALAIGTALGATVGLFAGLKPGSIIDRSISWVTYFSISIADFWLALLLVFVFAEQLQWVASAGYGTGLRNVALPICVLAVVPFANTAHIMRTSVIEESRMGYVLSARAKGFGTRAIVLRQILPNTAIPVGMLSVFELSRMVVAGVTVEVVFSWPGIGRLSADALANNDLYLVQAIVMVVAFLVVTINLLGDLLAFRLDPRTRSVISERVR